MGNTPKIYESPDGGLTVYERNFGDPVNLRKIVTTGSGNQYEHKTRNNRDIFEPIDPLSSSYQRAVLLKKYPELQDKWEEYIELEKHYRAWDLLSDK